MPESIHSTWKINNVSFKVRSLLRFAFWYNTLLFILCSLGNIKVTLAIIDIMEFMSVIELEKLDDVTMMVLGNLQATANTCF